VRAALARITLVLASLCFALGLVEGATRWFTHVVPPLGVADAVVGKTYIPNYAGTVYVDECDCDVFLRFNREGFRGPDRSYDKAPRTHRVAVIGDSMIAAIATAEENTLVSRLEKRLNAAPRPAGSPPATPPPSRRTSRTGPWEVMNFGVSGASTAQELVLYEERVRSYNPDVVVVGFFLRNDVIDNSPRLGSSPRIYFDVNRRGELFRVRAYEEREDERDWLNRHSRFYVWQKAMLARIHGRWSRMDRSRFSYLRVPRGDVAHAWELTRTLLIAFRDRVAADGASFVVAALPAAESVYDDVWNDLLARSGDEASLYDREAPEARLADICASANIPFIAMSDAFRAAARHASSLRTDEHLFWQRVGHFDARGNAIAAEILAQALRNDTGIKIRP